MIKIGIDEGANLAVGGLGLPTGFNKGYYIRPTLFTDVDNDMSIAQNEVFGPVLSIIPFENEDHAVKLANDTPYGLAASATEKLAGQLPSVTGVYDNAAEFPSSLPTYAHYLRRAGYQTVLSGKMHFVGPDQLHGFEERLTTDIYPPDFGWTPDYRKPGERIDWWYHNMGIVSKFYSMVFVFKRNNR